MLRRVEKWSIKKSVVVVSEEYLWKVATGGKMKERRKKVFFASIGNDSKTRTALPLDVEAARWRRLFKNR